MKILIVGSGGREHALAWKCSLSPKVEKIYCAPGNAGIAQLAELVPLKPDQFDELADFAASNEIDLTIIGMDDPLAGGIVDVFEARGLRVFGPRKRAAILEASKAFSKDLMKKYGIPTASYETFTKLEEAKEYLKKLGKFPVVLKASGLALGKGVLICEDLESALAGADAVACIGQLGEVVALLIERARGGRAVIAGAAGGQLGGEAVGGQVEGGEPPEAVQQVFDAAVWQAAAPVEVQQAVLGVEIQAVAEGLAPQVKHPAGFVEGNGHVNRLLVHLISL